MKTSALAVICLAMCCSLTAQRLPERARDAAARRAEDGGMILSHLGNPGSPLGAGVTPSTLGWGADDQAYPDRFAVGRLDLSEYVWVPAGEFRMGSNQSKSYNGPEHQVRITRGFWLAKHEVTNAQYRRFCQLTNRKFRARLSQGDDHPACWMDWQDAAAYCARVGKRLPTEAEWEYAARGPQSLTYPWGNQWDASKCCCEGHRGPTGKTFPVATFPGGAAWCGALDMIGNIAEYCADWWSDTYYTAQPATNPTGPATGQYRTVRGCSWYSGSMWCQTYSRIWVSDWEEGESDGIRPVMTP